MPPPPQPPTPSSSPDRTPHAAAGHDSPLLMHTGGFTMTNGFLFRAPAGWIAVDAPDDMAAWVDSLALPLAAILLTHSHFDHVSDAAKLQRIHRCPIYAYGPSTRESRLEDWVQMATGLRLAVDEYPVDFPLAGTTRAEVAGCGLHVAHVPGHSDDSIIFFDPAARRVFSGDTLMDGTHGRTDFPGGSYDQLIQGIRSKILPLGDDVTLCPGHGECSTIGAQRTWI